MLQDVSPGGGSSPHSTDPGQLNRRVGWACLAAGVGIGLILGLWSFDGPVPVPHWIGEYNDVSRRLLRLGHIAFLGLGIPNLLLARELAQLNLGEGAKRLAAGAMNFGNVFLPVTLIAASAWHPAKYAMSLPASAVFVAFVLAAWGSRPVSGGAASP